MVFSTMISFYKKVFLFFAFLQFFLMNGCSHIRSGHFIMLKQGETAKSLATEFQLEEHTILQHNQNKKFRTGEWIFIPLAQGIIPKVWPKSQNYGQGSMLWPVPTSRHISSIYGPRGGKIHHGIDIPASSGAYILASEEGKIIYSDKAIRGYGNLTIISHPNGLYTVYAHARKNFTKKGQKIAKGQVIAEVGNTGHSTGPHLHFEVRNRHSSINPTQFLETSGIQGN